MRIERWEKQRRTLLMYLAQWLLNVIWTPLFFALHQLGWAFAEVLMLLAAIHVTIYMSNLFPSASRKPL